MQPALNRNLTAQKPLFFGSWQFIGRSAKIVRRKLEACHATDRSERLL